MGNKEHFVRQAFLELSLHPEITLLKESEILQTEALEFTDQPDFFNAIAKIRTSLLPYDLLQTLQSIENKLGRIRRFDKGPREIDLDILTYENLVLDMDDLALPHHSLFTRPFIREILAGMNEEGIYQKFREIGHAKYRQSVQG